MLSVLSRYQTYTPRLPAPVRNVLAGAGGGAFARFVAPRSQGTDINSLSVEALSIEIEDDATTPMEKLGTHTQRLSDNEDWDKLSGLIRSFDTRRATFGGSRLARLAAEGAADGDLCKLSRAAAARPNDVYIAAVAALGHINAALEGREKTGSERKKYEAWITYYHHVEQATDLMEGLDASKLDSPLIAAVQHLVATHHDYAPTQIDHCFANAIALDPTDWDVMGTHARSLTQSGSRATDRIEIAARNAMGVSQHIAGASAYAAFYLGLVAADIDALDEMDVPLFEQGLFDMIAYGDNDPIEINRIAARCARSTQVIVRPAAIKVIRNAMRSLVPMLWSMPEKDARKHVAMAYAAELQAGKTVRIAHSGVETAMGRAA